MTLRLLSLLLFALLSPRARAAQISGAPSENSARLAPVLLVHGIGQNAARLEHLASFLRAGGREVHAINLESKWGQAGLEELALQVALFANRELPNGARFDLVGFSMGGLVSRYYVQRLCGAARVDHFITLSSPHRGTLLAYCLPLPGVRQMRPGSGFLRDLSVDLESLENVHFTALWTPLDVTIIPAKNSIPPVGANHRIWCLAHPLMVWDPRCLRAVESALNAV